MSKQRTALVFSALILASGLIGCTAVMNQSDSPADRVAQAKEVAKLAESGQSPNELEPVKVQPVLQTEPPVQVTEDQIDRPTQEAQPNTESVELNELIQEAEVPTEPLPTVAPASPEVLGNEPVIVLETQPAVQLEEPEAQQQELQPEASTLPEAVPTEAVESIPPEFTPESQPSRWRMP